MTEWAWGVPNTDFKHHINQYILSTWQDDWKEGNVLFNYAQHILLAARVLLYAPSHRQDSSWCDGSSDQSFMGWTHLAISHSSQCFTTGVTKAVVCAILSMGLCI